jgi:hypothetical protein
VLSETARRAVEAYGGEARWKAASAVEAIFSAGGEAFVAKRRPFFERASITVPVAAPGARIRPVDRRGHVGVLEGNSVRLEGARGKVIASRTDPRSLFPGGRRAHWWDRLDIAYFAGYAMWNYLTLPALLLRDDIAWREAEPGVLDATFPAHLPTHCPDQRFHFDPSTGLLTRHDYTAEVFGEWARAAHVVLEHGSWEGVPYPSKRRVTPRMPDGHVAENPVLIWIELHEWRLL